MSNTDVSKLFALSNIKTTDGKSIKGVDKNNFFMTTNSIFDTEKFDANTVFADLDVNNDKVLTTDELAALSQYMNADFMKQQEEVSSKPDNIHDILNSNEEFMVKLNQIKELKLTNDDIKDLDKSEIQDLLNLIAGAYADEPEKIPNDSLCSQILQNRPKEELQEIVNDPKSGYWLSKYGKEYLNASLEDRQVNKEALPDNAKSKILSFNLNGGTGAGVED